MIGLYLIRYCDGRVEVAETEIALRRAAQLRKQRAPGYRGRYVIDDIAVVCNRDDENGDSR